MNDTRNQLQPGDRVRIVGGTIHNLGRVGTYLGLHESPGKHRVHYDGDPQWMTAQHPLWHLEPVDSP